jgi:hypothetical protein
MLKGKDSFIYEIKSVFSIEKGSHEIIHWYVWDLDGQLHSGEATTICLARKKATEVWNLTRKQKGVDLPKKCRRIGMIHHEL